MERNEKYEKKNARQEESENKQEDLWENYKKREKIQVKR